MLVPIYGNFPQKLIAQRHWIVWKLELKDGKWTKVPYNPSNPKYGAKSNNPKTWGTFEQARKIAEGSKEFTGIGYMFSKGCPFTGVDLDHCRDPKTGEIEPWALKEVHRLDTYAEASPSGTGVHALVEGRLPPGGRKKGNYEMYSELRYFTMTGYHLEGTLTTIESREKELKAFHVEVMARPKTSPKPPGPSLSLNIVDSDILTKARSARNGGKFSQLERGNWQGTGYPSQSEADIAFCSMLAFYTQNPEQIDRLFRASALYREKWNRPTAGSTYGAKTIEKALARVTGIYQGTRKQALNNRP